MLSFTPWTKGRSVIAAISRWCSDWAEGGELACCGEREIERMAKDVGMSPGELRSMVNQGPQAADLLLQRMVALDLDREEVSQTAPGTFQDLQRVCSLCKSRRQCARDLGRDPNGVQWKDYCPNAATLIALDALPWAARREW